MFCGHNIFFNPDLRLKPCSVVIIWNSDFAVHWTFSANTRFLCALEFPLPPPTFLPPKTCFCYPYCCSNGFPKFWPFFFLYSCPYCFILYLYFCFFNAPRSSHCPSPAPSYPSPCLLCLLPHRHPSPPGNLRHAGCWGSQAHWHCWRESKEYLQQVPIHSTKFGLLWPWKLVPRLHQRKSSSRTWLCFVAGWTKTMMGAWQRRSSWRAASRTTNCPRCWPPMWRHKGAGPQGPSHGPQQPRLQTRCV